MYQYEDGTNGKKEWKEKGVGTLKLNTTAEMTDDGQDVVRDAPYQCRLLLRTDGVHRLILNQSLVKGLKFGDENGDRPTKKQFLLIVSPSILLSVSAGCSAFLFLRYLLTMCTRSVRLAKRESSMIRSSSSWILANHSHDHPSRLRTVWQNIQGIGAAMSPLASV